MSPELCSDILSLLLGMSQDDPLSAKPSKGPAGNVIRHDAKSYLEPHVHPPPVPVPHPHVVPGTLAATAKKWNTDSLGMRLALDAASATASAALICPIVTIIDRYEESPYPTPPVAKR